MIPALLLLAATVAAPQCPVALDPAASLCRALAASDAQRFGDAAVEFERAAAGSPAGDPRTQRMLAAAGNMWIAAGQPGKAAVALDRALGGAGLAAEQRGLALLDRARVAEAQGNLKLARRYVTEAQRSAADDPFLWYFSAALAIREEDLPAARLAIARALTLAPNDPDVLFEAGHVARAEGDVGRARDYWQRALAGDPAGKTGEAARKALSLVDVPIAVTSPAAPAPVKDTK